jgi:hypothetical protein
MQVLIWAVFLAGAFASRYFFGVQGKFAYAVAVLRYLIAAPMMSSARSRRRCAARLLPLALAGLICAPELCFGAAPKACAASTELECIQSPKCKLEQTPPHGPYYCRDAVGRCEVGFVQSGQGRRESCETKPGCVFQPDHCYCPPDRHCICGSGPPPQCVETGAKADA